MDATGLRASALEPPARRRADPSVKAVVLLLFVGTAGCALVPPMDPEPALAPQAVTDCSPPFAFEGETTLAAIGLGDIEAAQGEANRRGSIRITQHTVPWEAFAPPGVPPVVPEGQLLCVTWPDGSGMSTMLTEPFARPGSDGAEANGTTEALPVLPVIVAFVLLLLAGVSWLAFRREGDR
jgi:hypothetical protein